MKPRFVLLLLACLFVFAQYVSIEQTTTVVSSIVDNDDIEDLSLEDVVPVDPFLAPGTGKPTKIEIIVAHAVALIAPLIVTHAKQPEDKLCLRIEKEHCGSPPEKLWLVNRVLLI